MKPVRVRFAPSPTGHLHVGGARTALFNYLFARHHDGTFVLRIEDTDTERNTEESLQGILEGLAWLGLTWDEGPYHQSQRLDVYREHLQRLLEAGRAYPCFCTPEELDAMRAEQRARGEATGYNGRCFHLSEEERQAKLDAGVPRAYRFRVEREGETVIDDLIRGKVVFHNSVLDDFVIVKSDGMPTYQFAVVVDDALMGITHVIRGEEHLSNTPKQMQLYDALGYEPPQFAHIPLILAPDRSKLSKRHGAVWVGQFRDQGYLPEAFINYLALLGWAYDDKTEIFSRDELIRYFELEKVSRNGAVFDYKKLQWMNGVYLRELSLEEFVERSLPYLRGIVPDEMSEQERERLARILSLLQTRVSTLGELPAQVEYFYSDEVTFDPKAVRKFFTRDYVPALFDKLLAEFVSLAPFTEERIEPIFHRLRDEFELKLGDVIQPVRVAVTGSTVSPPMYETLALLGRAKTCERLRRAAAYIKQMPAESAQ